MAGDQEDGYREALQRLEAVLHDESKDPTPLPLSLLEKITENFSENEKIGEGSFATVYKGRLPKGTVAVKRLMEIKETEFNNEVNCMKKAKHKNIVRFIGYCDEPLHHEMLLCSEYVPNGSLDRYIKDKFCRFQWSTRYQIIKGICEGLDYLHRQREAIIHRDLKPQNILLDHNMVPKIADFGLSRCFRVDQSHGTTERMGGTIIYMAPEVYNYAEFTTRSDIYSLGIVIMDLLMGRNKYNDFLWTQNEGRYKIKKVLKFWANAFRTQKRNDILQKQVKVCAAIAMQCLNMMDPEDVKKYVANDKYFDDPYMTMNYRPGPSSNFQSVRQTEKDPKKRPSATEIIDWLGATENWPSLSQELQLNLSTESEVLDIHPRVLCFHFGGHVASSCFVLNLTNKSSDHYIGFWIKRQQDINCMYAGRSIVGPLTTKVVTAELSSVSGYPPVDTGSVNILTVTMRKEMWDSRSDNGSSFFEKIRRPTRSDLQSLGGEVHEALLAVVVCPLQSLGGEVLISNRTMDVHPTKPWILINYNKRVSIWNCQRKITEKEFELKKNTMVRSVKFIAGDREQRIAVGDSSGIISVISCNTGEITNTLFRLDKKGVAITSLAIHPEEPLLLWADEDGVINLQSWRGQTYIRTFGGDLDGVTQVKFNPKDKNTFVSIEACGLIKVRKINSISAQPAATLGEELLGLASGCHPVGPFDYLYTYSDRQHVIASLRKGVAIWDLEAEADHKVAEISFGRRAIATAIACHPIHPLIVLGTRDNDISTTSAAISLYNATNYRMQKMIKYTHGDVIREFGFIGSTWLVVRYDDDRIEVLEIDMTR